MTYGKVNRRGALATVLALWVLVALFGACRSDTSQPLLVFAAASLSDPLSEVGEQFSRETGATVSFSFDGSGALAQRIRQGAPADLFISAGPSPMDLLVEGGRVTPETRVNLLGNRLILVAPLRQDVPLTSLEQLKSPAIGRIAIADPDLAPAGVYAREALQQLEIWEAIRAKVVPAASDRVALGYVETGAADAGIVYQTDAALSRGVWVVLTLPAESHAPIAYPAAVVTGTVHPDLARRFLAFLQGPAAREVFRRYGFIFPPQESG